MYKVKKKAVIEENTYDAVLINKIQPQGGIKFKDEEVIRTGTGYEVCLHIYDFPSELLDNWLANVTNISNTVVTVDIASEDINEIKTNINRSMKEQNERVRSAENYTDYADANARFIELKEMYEEINSLSEAIKLLDIRIFVSARTWVELEEKAQNIMTPLETSGYRPTIFLNENKNEWKSMYLPYKKQQENTFSVPGQPLSSVAVGYGNPFHFSNLEDPFGSYFGQTSCGGNVIWDLFMKTPTRRYYNALAFGTMGSGKSTLLKKIFADRASRGDFIRNFDIVGDYNKLTNEFGGKIIKPDGSNGILNMLEILKSGDNEQVNFARHFSKLLTIYKYLNTEADQEEITDYNNLLREFYEYYDLTPVDKDGAVRQVSGLPATTYPILSNLLDFTKDKIGKTMLDADDMNAVEIEVAKHNILILEKIRKTIELLVFTYGYMFDGHTNMDNIIDEQIVNFDISDLKEMDPKIFDVQIFNMLSLCWDNCVANGKIMKEKYETGKIKLEDVIHFIILADESHRWINTNKLQALDLVAIFEREARKFFGSFIMASQSVRDYVPEGSSDIAINKIKTIFELTQYKYIFQQDSNSQKLIDSVFDHVLTESQLQAIPNLEMGETILSISSDITLQFKIHLSEEENFIYSGGA